MREDGRNALGDGRPRLSRYPVDLQVHTTCSDGTMKPAAVVALAARLNVRVIAITDHDSVAGVDEAIEAGREHGVRVIPAVEFSIRHEPERDLCDLDVLGYWIDHRHPALLAALQRVQAGRVAQKREMVERLRRMGYRIRWEDVLALAQGVPGRPHIARVLVARHPDEFPTQDVVFQKLLKPGSPVYVEQTQALRLEEAVQLIRTAGGIPVLAHPGLYTNVRNLEEVIAKARAAGVLGLEVWYPYRKTRVCPTGAIEEEERLCRRFAAIADRLGMLKTGGSDFHGPEKGVALGEQGLTYEEFEALQRRVASLIGAIPR